MFRTNLHLDIQLEDQGKDSKVGFSWSSSSSPNLEQKIKNFYLALSFYLLSCLAPVSPSHSVSVTCSHVPCWGWLVTTHCLMFTITSRDEHNRHRSSSKFLPLPPMPQSHIWNRILACLGFHTILWQSAFMFLSNYRVSAEHCCYRLFSYLGARVQVLLF